MKRMKSILLIVLTALSLGEAKAGSAESLSLSASQPVATIHLHGTRSRTLYRTEAYMGTCTRDESYSDTCFRSEPFTDFETRCSPRSHEECSNTPPSCQNVCRDVMRPVCDSNGCRDFPTRECTQECSGGGNSCHTVGDAPDCRQVLVTRYRDVAYSCTRTRQVRYSCELSRQVPDGTEVVDDRDTNVTLTISGDVASLTGKDLLSLRAPDGVDVSDFDTTLTAVASANTHLIYATKTSSTNQSAGSRHSVVNVGYSVRVIEKNKVKVPVSRLESIGSDATNISFILSGAAVDSNTRIHVKLEKDRFIGPFTTVIDQDVPASALKLSALSSGAKQQGVISVAALGYEYNRRPHRLTVSFTRDLRSSLSKDLLNPGIFSVMSILSTGSLTIEGRFGR